MGQMMVFLVPEAAQPGGLALRMHIPFAITPVRYGIRFARASSGPSRGFGMEADAKKIASGDKWGYIGLQPKGKMDIPGRRSNG